MLLELGSKPENVHRPLAVAVGHPLIGEAVTEGQGIQAGFLQLGLELFGSHAVAVQMSNWRTLKAISFVLLLLLTS